MNASSALAVVCGVCVGVALASTMGVLALSGRNIEALQIGARKNITMPVGGTVSSLSADSFLLTQDEDPLKPAQTILVHYDKDTAMLVRMLMPDQQGTIVDSRLVHTVPAKTLTEGLRIRVILWLSAEQTVPYAIMIFTSPTQ